jgi:hypothetical protein
MAGKDQVATVSGGITLQETVQEKGRRLYLGDGGWPDRYHMPPEASDPPRGHFHLFEWTGRLLVGFAKPFETVGTAPGAIGNLPVLPFGTDHVGTIGARPPQEAGALRSSWPAPP